MGISYGKRHILLGELLFALRDPETTVEGDFSVHLTYLDTSDESFPKEYRGECMHYTELFARAYSHNDRSILDRTINHMGIVPLKHLGIDDRYIHRVYVDRDKGYLFNSKINVANGKNNNDDKSIAVALKIVLDMDNQNNKEENDG